MADSFRSARILARPVSEDDAPEVAGVYEGNGELLRLLDRESDPSVLAGRFVHRQSLPSRVPAAGLRNMVLCDTESGQVFGLLSLCMGYPTERIAYIGELFLHPGFQGQGLGREVYLRLEGLLRLSPMRRVRVGVGLKNWNALRFWIRLGFTHITGMSGDRHFSPDGHAYLELQKSL